jgi:hypothetical protein
MPRKFRISHSVDCRALQDPLQTRVTELSKTSHHKPEAALARVNARLAKGEAEIRELHAALQTKDGEVAAYVNTIAEAERAFEEELNEAGRGSCELLPARLTLEVPNWTKRHVKTNVESSCCRLSCRLLEISQV